MTTCQDLEKEPGFPGCCDSCHDEADQGFHDLIEHDDHRLCCRVANWRDEQTSEEG